jgi:phenylpropionate dioxygenase-like ring-hydroxylating dioxygenase large terminal subunit
MPYSVVRLLGELVVIHAVRQPWYPVEERYGFIFAYLGPLDRKPPVPKYDLLEELPEGWEIVADDTSIPSGGAGYLPCNWLQHHENGIDPAHMPIVHEHQFPPMMAKADVTNIFEAQADRIYGNGVFRLDGMMMDFKVEIVIPNVRIIPSPLLPVPRPDGKSDQISWALPKDDTDTMVFTAIVQPKDAKPMAMTLKYNVTVIGDTLEGTFKPGMFPKSKLMGVRG